MFFLQILCIVGVIMLTDKNTMFRNFSSRDLLITAVIVYVIITLAFIIVIIVDDNPRMLCMIFFGTGGILNVVGGILCFMLYSDYDSCGNCMILGITTIVCGILMIVDTILLLLNKIQ